MAAQLSRPGVEVIQVFKSVSPTIITPTLVPNITGVGKQIVEVLVSDGAGGEVLNTDALIALPGMAIAKDAVGLVPVYTGLNLLTLVFSTNGGIDVTVTFAGNSLTPASVVAQVNAALALAGATASVAETYTVNGSGLDLAWRLRTIGLGEFNSITIKPTSSPVVLSAFGFGVKTYAGINNYNQYIVEIPSLAFPDPRGNIAELAFILDTVRVFLSLGNGTGLLEASRTSAFLRNGSVDEPAFVDGVVDITAQGYPGFVSTKVINIRINGTVITQYAATAADTTFTLFLANFNTYFNPFGVEIVLLPSNFVRIQTIATGGAQKLEILTPNTLPAALGVATGTFLGHSITAVDDGNGDAVTPLLKFSGLLSPAVDFNATATAAVLTGTAPFLVVSAGDTLIISDGGQPQTITFATTVLVVGVGSLKEQIEAVMGLAAGGKITVSSNAGAVELTHSDLGTDSVIRIIGGTALASLFLSVGFTRGIPGKPEAADELWIDGLYFADIVERAPGGVVDRLKINKQVAISTTVGTTYYIVAKNLVSPPPVGRPRPELVINLFGTAVIKQELLRDITGARIENKAPLYLAYEAVRKDVTALAAQPGLLKFDDTAQLGAALSPITTGNPLALGLFLALVNAPGVQVTGLGVDEVTDDAPYGTVEAFTRAAEFLEAAEVYAIAPLTHDPVVHQVFMTHVSVMSEPANKGERVVLINPSMPTNRRDTLVASGTTGDRISTNVFDTKVSNLSALVLNAGISPVGTIAVSKGLFLDLTTDAKRYSISSISGSQVTLRTTFLPGENDDNYYTTDSIPSILISETFSVAIRGTALVTVNNTPDNQGIAETIQALGQSYGNRRVWMVFPDKTATTLEGLEQVIEGFYMCAGIAGMIGQQPPQQSFTNYPMTGYTRVIGSNDRFSQRQINVMAAGGAYVVVQDSVGGPLISQFALTTDLTSIETRTDSITKVVDFTAKFLRRGIKNFIGRFNVTQGLLDTLSSVIQGLLGFLVENGVLIGADLNNIIQDENAPDTVLVEVRLDVPYPCNFIKLTLEV